MLFYFARSPGPSPSPYTPWWHTQTTMMTVRESQTDWAVIIGRSVVHMMWTVSLTLSNFLPRCHDHDDLFQVVLFVLFVLFVCCYYFFFNSVVWLIVCHRDWHPLAVSARVSLAVSHRDLSSTLSGKTDHVAIMNFYVHITGTRTLSWYFCNEFFN